MERERCCAPVGWILIAVGCTFLTGCEKSQPPLAGGKPISHWIQALSDSNPKVRKEAVFKLGNAGESDAAVIPAIFKSLKDRDARVRCEAILALLKANPDSKEATDSLAELQLHDRDPKVREYACSGLKKLQKASGLIDGTQSQ